MTGDLAAIDRTIATLRRRLLESRTSSGHWEGRLASSALSTATAMVALKLSERASGSDHLSLIRRGLEWLTANQNGDGGWGDTVVSSSNLSTTALCWAALGFVVGEGVQAQAAVDRAGLWISSRVGNLSAEGLKQAIIARYGKDQTFSVPILTVLALTGKFGSGSAAWRMVPQLPFELAACPHQFFRWLRLPVVSYALPALVAIGHARHHHAPSRNPLFAALRSALRLRTLRKAREMQPGSGGYLEAIPLTAFVVMSLIDSGAAKDTVVSRGIHFLETSARPDGSWPIDTNLATWTTTLSVEALGSEDLPAHDREAVLQWLLGQQVSVEHPFTHSKPGGWAWTDLTGGVPDADDTSGALLALWKLDGATRLDAATAGVQWLLDLQNSDGGIPTFCRGWGALPFDRSAPDLTAHSLEAWSRWYPFLMPAFQERVKRAAERAVSYLARCQSADGSWIPLWFGNQHTPEESNPTYGTARVIAALTVPLVSASDAGREIRDRGVRWLLNAQAKDGGWGGGPGGPASIEETGLAVAALAATSGVDKANGAIDAMLRGAQWLITATDEGRETPASPIGLYFARLWYYEDLYPTIFALHGLSELRATLDASNSLA